MAKDMASMDPSGVSICIATYRRPALLKVCIESIFPTAVSPLEIIVSDDDYGEASRAAIAALQIPVGVRLIHVPNAEPKGQSGNVSNAFSLAAYERLVLLHDDDFLLPGGLDRLDAAWRDAEGNVDAAYGQQIVTDALGQPDPAATRYANEHHFRNLPAGPQQSNLWCALVQQFPSNAWMVRRSVVAKTGYPTEREVGRVPVDYHFAIRYALASTRPFVLVPEPVSAYRESEESILRGPQLRRAPQAHLSFLALEKVRVSSPLERTTLLATLGRVAPNAMRGFIAHGSRREALRVLRAHFARMSWRARIGMSAVLAAEACGVRIIPRGGAEL